MTTTTDATRPGIDEPVPYTLTPLGYVALTFDALRTIATEPPVDELAATDEWACNCCGAAFFGPCPDDGLCPPCRDADECLRCGSRFSTAAGPRPCPACSSDFL